MFTLSESTKNKLDVGDILEEPSSGFKFVITNIIGGHNKKYLVMDLVASIFGQIRKINTTTATNYYGYIVRKPNEFTDDDIEFIELANLQDLYDWE